MTNTRKSKIFANRRSIGLACVWGTLGVHKVAEAIQPAPIFDYTVREKAGYDGANPAPGVIMWCPFAGWDYPATDNTTTSSYTYQFSQNWPVAFFLIGPQVAPYTTSASTAETTLSQTVSWFDTSNVPLNYVMTDYEPYNGNTQADVNAQIQNTVSLVRGASSSNVSSAYIGNYADYPGGPDASIYSTYGLTIAMPNAYPYADYETASGNPNARSALFWTPLNMITVAKNNLPAGNKLIPWLSSYESSSSYADTPPTIEDNVAMIVHTRLRGADGYYDLGGLSGYTYAWTDLNWVFDGTGSTKILNLTTSQSTGFQWSGYQNGTNEAFIFSNLGSSASSVALPTLTGVPASSPTVAAGTHVEMYYINDVTHLSSDTINLGRDNINGMLYVNSSITVNNSIVLPALPSGDTSVVTIGSDISQSDSPVFGGPISLSNNVTLQSAANTITLSGIISGTGLVTKTGIGLVTLSGINIYSGGTNISAGAILATKNASLGTGTIDILNGGASTASLQLSGGVTITNTFAGFASETGGNTPTIESVSGNDVVTSPLSILYTGGNGAIFQADAGSTLNLSGGLTTTLPSSRIYYLQGAGNGFVPGSITDSASKILALNKNGTGTWTLGGNNNYAAGTSVVAGTLIFASPGAMPAFTSLSITGAAMAANHGTAAKNTLFVSSLTLAGTINNSTGLLDLTNNDLVVRNGSLGTLNAEVRQGYNAGGVTWQGSGGIVSSTAASDSTHLTALGIIQNSVDGTPTGKALTPSFDGLGVYDYDVLIKYTYYGDTNLDGTVDGSDYSRIDAACLANQTTPGSMTGWYNGDFNYDGVINGSDYTLIDNAYNTQGALISAEFASPTAQVSGVTSSVPEPAAVGLLSLGAIGILARRRRRSKSACVSTSYLSFRAN